MPRLTTRNLMIGVALAALGLAGSVGLARLAEEWRYATWAYGPNTSIFPIGQGVVMVENVRFEGVALAEGTAGVVMGDPPDEDSAYPDRLVSVRIADGPHRGATFGIRRRALRAR